MQRGRCARLAYRAARILSERPLLTKHAADLAQPDSHYGVADTKLLGKLRDARIILDVHTAHALQFGY